MQTITILVGPPASGKSTFARKLVSGSTNIVYVNQDSQGKVHMDVFNRALSIGSDVVVDRMNFNAKQRERYITPAKALGYKVVIKVFNTPRKWCYLNAIQRFDTHETIKDVESLENALETFFSKYEAPTANEGKIEIIEHYTGGAYGYRQKERAIWVDLDGTLCDCNHRRHHVRPTDGSKKNWVKFFEGIKDDMPVDAVFEIIRSMCNEYKIVYCTGRSEEYRSVTEDWLKRHNVPKGPLFMRPKTDSRADFLVKENILNFEIRPRYDIIFCIDDRNQVVDMLRRNGLTVLQPAEGEF